MLKRPRIRQPVNKRIEKQRKRGVIPSLYGFFDRKYSHLIDSPRKRLKDSIRMARKHQMPTGTYYSTVGGHYANMDHYFGKLFESFIQGQIKLTQAQGLKPVRILDIGPGLTERFMHGLRRLDPTLKHMQIHTISPEQINPKTRRTQNVQRVLTLSSGERLPVFEQEPNPNYEKRLRHHVQAIETINPKKFKRKFDVIVSVWGGTRYAIEPVTETIIKVARLLNPKGKAFLHTATLRPADLEILEKELGKNYDIKITDGSRKTFATAIIITRKR
ncbi:MAG: hypothetical protein Q7S92_06935 [Candidatus Diapherotrites archaeon]|nr:hypothetical protein [Candidatus Diapherotrites archaeon]